MNILCRQLSASRRKMFLTRTFVKKIKKNPKIILGLKSSFIIRLSF